MKKSIYALGIAILAVAMSCCTAKTEHKNLEKHTVLQASVTPHSTATNAELVKLQDAWNEMGKEMTTRGVVATLGCVCSSWQPSPTQEHPDRSMRICGAFPGPGGCIQERYCNYCAVWPDCGDCSM